MIAGLLQESAIETAEWYTSAGFAVVLLLLLLYILQQIQGHELHGSSEAPSNWHAAPFGISSLRGQAFRSLTDKEGCMLAPRAIPGQVDAPRPGGINANIGFFCDEDDETREACRQKCLENEACNWRMGMCKLRSA